MQRDLVERAMAADRDAFSELGRGQIDRLYAIARLILRDGDRAHDATQEALIGAWRDLKGLRDPDKFEPWIRRLLVNACYTEARGGNENGEDKIYLVDIETGEATLLSDEWTGQFDASFSPDGSHVLFSRNESNWFDPQPVILDLETLAKTPLDVRMWAREWSPDGESIIGFAKADNSLVVVSAGSGITSDEGMTVLEGTSYADDLSWQRLAP